VAWPTSRFRLDALVVVVIALVLALTRPSSADAHVKTGLLSTDFEARISGLRPPAAGVTASILGGDQKLELHVAGTHVVIVLGIVGEPFLRFSPSGVEVNRASPTATNDGVVSASDALPPGRPAWRQVSGDHSYSWHENRLRPLPQVSTGSDAARRVTSWSIPLVVDGRRSALVGGEWFEQRQPLAPWIAAGVALLLLAAVAARFAHDALRRRVAAALLVAAVGSLLVGWSGIGLEGRTSMLGLILAGAFTCSGGACALAAVAASPGAAREPAMALVGAFAATFAAPQLGVFAHGFVLSALPPGTARALAAVAVVGGTAVVVLGLPATIRLFGTP